MAQNKQKQIGLSFPREFIALIDQVIEKRPDFKTRGAVLRYALRKYADEVGKENLENKTV